MQPQASNIRDIAIYDPVTAYGLLLGIPRVPYIFNVRGTFSSFTIPANPVIGDLNIDGTIAQRTWIEKIDYSLLVPNAFAGNVFKTLWDSQLKQQPGINVKLSIRSGPRYVVSPQFTPLENLAQLWAVRWPAGWPLYKQQSVQAEFQLTQPPGGTTTPPYTVVLTFSGWQFLDYTVDEITPETARVRLKEAGIWVPNDPGCAIG